MEVDSVVKRIQIPSSLYELMVSYIHDHYDPSDHERFAQIEAGIHAKHEAETRRNIYTAYKAEADPGTREILRQSYMDKAGIPSHGRWDVDVEQQYREGNFDC